MFRRAFPRFAAIAMACGVVVHAHARDRSSPIDPDPSSPTLGQLLDAMRPTINPSPTPRQPTPRFEQRPMPQRPSLPVADPPPPRSETKPAQPAPPAPVSVERLRPALRQAASMPSTPPRRNEPDLTTGTVAPAREAPAAVLRAPSFQPASSNPGRSSTLQPPDFRPAQDLVAQRPAVAPVSLTSTQPLPPAATAQPREAEAGDAGFVYVIDQDLRSFLTDTAKRFGLRAEIASGIRGRLTRVRLPAEPRALLRELSTAYEIEWLLEGDVLKVTSRSEIATRILPLDNVTFEDWSRELAAAGLDLSRYAPVRMQGSNAAILTAPVALLARATAILEAMKNVKASSQEIRLIRGGVSQKVQFD